jgi:signal transduction histidine kinase
MFGLPSDEWAIALELNVRDDGLGFDPALGRAKAVHSTSLGLLGMEERVSLVGGQVTICSVPGRGTEVSASFPVGTSVGQPS